MLHASKAGAHGKRVDWTIHQLNEDILYHYWFQYHRFVCNNKEEQFLVVVVLKAKTSSKDYVTFLVSKIWFVVVASRTHQTKRYKWAYHECMVVAKGNIYKHQMKVLLMLHLAFVEGNITKYCDVLKGVVQA